MLHTHHLNTATHSDFLKQERIDPITGEKIEEGHTIVICAACKSAFFIESWEYLGEKHCNQENTLPEIPIAHTLQLAAKPLEYLPFYFKKGKYILDRGDGKNSDFASKAFVLIVGMIFYFPVLIILSSFVGTLFSPLGGVAFAGAMMWFTGAKIKPYYNGKKAFSNISAHKGIHLAVNLKSQSIEYKKKDKKTSIPFERIKYIKYYFDYIPYAECGKHLQNSISLEISTKDYKQIRFYTFLHQNEIPQWSKFLEELPYTIPVLNQK